MSTQQPEALRLADVFEKEGYAVFTNDMQKAAAELRRLHAINAELLDVLRSTGLFFLFLHHCWCDVQMNDYSFEKLNQQISAIDAAIAKAGGEA